MDHHDTSRHPNTKLGKHKYLIKHDEINKHIPETWRANESNIRKLLEEHRMVYVKPNHGTGGYGVFRVEKRTAENQDSYCYLEGNQTLTFASFEDLYSSLQKRISSRTYLVQKGIHLLKYRNRPFDIRIMVQRNPKGKWEVTGVIGRLAHPKKIVTNYHNGGTPLPIETLLATHVKKENQVKYISSLKKLAHTTSKYLHTGYPKIRSMGVDVAIDNNLFPWILEVNTKPDMYIFKTLKDKSVFYKIRRYSKFKSP